MDNQTAPVSSVPPSVNPKPATGTGNNTLMGVLAYLGILVIIPYLMAKDNPFVKFHIKQGIVLAVIEIILWAISGMFWGLYFIISLVNLATIILSIIGIVNVVQKKEKELPLVGSYASHINI